ncbi:pentapeptide repeat-containing protein [Pseudodonghicola sp.]|uniref:pentapeptide repeat-containing protein n=1 Tax=Pseudodonghicola sp. TaxID=1969463 RepID=UPI003A976181
MSDQTTTLPIPPDVFWAIAGIGGLALLTLVIFGAMVPAGSNSVAPLERLKDRLGLASLNSGLFLIVLTFWGALFLTLTVGLIWLIWDLIWMGIPDDPGGVWGFSIARIAGLTATLGAVVALPFTLIKVRMTGEQTRTAQEGLITDRINKAVEGLGAEKIIHFRGRVVYWKNKNGDLELRDGFTQYWGDGPDIKHRLPSYMRGMSEDEMDQHLQFGDWTNISKTVPNLEIRIGAIYALERIAQDSDRDHVQVIEILCAYIRENSPAQTGARSPHEISEKLAEGTEHGPGLNPEQIYLHPDYREANTGGWTPLELNDETLDHWASSLPRIRQDIQTALSVLGRRPEKGIQLERNRNPKAFRLDLSHSNLQRANLSDCNFTNAIFIGSCFEGAYCARADFSGASFKNSKLWATVFENATFRECYFRGNPGFLKILLENQVSGSLVRDTDLTEQNISAEKLHTILCDCSVKSTEEQEQPHWITTPLPWGELKRRWHDWARRNNCSAY